MVIGLLVVLSGQFLIGPFPPLAKVGARLVGDAYFFFFFFFGWLKVVLG